MFQDHLLSHTCWRIVSFLVDGSTDSLNMDADIGSESCHFISYVWELFQVVKAGIYSIAWNRPTVSEYQGHDRQA